jgi:hypothetical protein
VNRRLALLLGLTCAAALAACRQFLPMPTNSFLQPRQGTRVSMSTADARQYFEHDKHAKAFGATGVQCIDCHRFDFVIDSGDPKQYEPLSAHAILPGSAACHFCHQDGPGRMAAAPAACTTCHTNLAPLKPPDHQIAWMKVHGTEARGDPVQCESCHRQSYCINCHNTRDTIQTIQHERNFLFVHGIEARTDPMQCSACHREDFCINCHLQGRKGTP